MSINEKMTAIADAIRTKTGGNEPLTLDQMAQEIAGIQTGAGEDDVLVQLLNRTITRFESDKITELGGRSFCSCKALISLSLPNCVTTDEGSLQDCTSLETVHLPNLSNLGIRCFMNCTKIEELVFPKVSSASTYVFYGCSALKKCDLHAVKYIGNISFQNCKSLKALIIRTNSLCTLAGSAVFTGSGIESGTGCIYVPSALLEEYQSATNWSVYADQFQAIEGSEYE